VPDLPAAVAYVDTSAVVKLVVREAQSDALERELLTWRNLATSTITTIELPRAVQRARAEGRESVARIEAIAVLLGAIAEIPLSPGTIYRLHARARRAPQA
jgi:predicted nucleic acid-binding protein